MNDMYNWKILVILDKIERCMFIEEWARADIDSYLNSDYNIDKAFQVFLRRCCYFEGPKPASMGADEKKEYYDIVKLFLECGASASARDFDGLTPAIYVVMKGDVDALNLLINYGADINESVPQCPHLLVYAERRGHNRVIEFLSRKIWPRGGQIEFNFNFGY